MSSQSSEQVKKDRKRVVVDTSIVLSATLIDGADRKLIRKLLQMDYELCIPLDVINEYQEVARKPKFKKYQPLFLEILDELKKSSILLPLATKIKYKVPGSEEDEAIINCCVENAIDYLVTRDKRTVGTYNGLEVIFAQDFFFQFLSN